MFQMIIRVTIVYIALIGGKFKDFMSFDAACKEKPWQVLKVEWRDNPCFGYLDSGLCSLVEDDGRRDLCERSVARRELSRLNGNNHSETDDLFAVCAEFLSPPRPYKLTTLFCGGK